MCIRHCLALAALLLAGCGSSTSETGAAGEVAAAPAAARADSSTAPVAVDTADPEPEPATMNPQQDAAPPIELRNRLGDETSPYLLQHAQNPVAWYPWGEEAFEAARALDRPILVSVGYSTCYWCHVMERESFEDEAVAAILNEHFVCIKVDREERPDVDDIYMNAVHMLNDGQGGWPANIFLEPDGLKPFLAGTYFPPVDGRGRPSFTSVLQQIITFWNDRRPDILQQANLVAGRIEQIMGEVPPTVGLSTDDVERGVDQVMAIHDAVNGGFVGNPRRAPKFPIPVTVDFLMAAGWEREDVRAAVALTLDRMAIGGMYDQVGGGFHRYSTDAVWLVPHFEKMLYDNGQLAATYAAAYERTQDPLYARVVRRTLDYVLREMTADSGMFYSAQDAEVNHREGENYLWLPDEVRAALTDAGLSGDVDTIMTVYGLAAGTNFQDPHHPEDAPKNVVHLTDRTEVLAAALDIDEQTLLEIIDRANAAMLVVRDGRDQPGLDDKILTGWNGMMIRGMADAGRILDEPRYVDAARRAADALLGLMRQRDGSLLRTARGGEARIDAFLEDYALLIDGLLALHEATDEAHHLDMAEALAAAARSRFWDDRVGGYFDTLDGQTDLFVRMRSNYDGAVPCGNSAMAMNLVTLHARTGNERYLDDAAATLRSLSTPLADRPANSVLAARALLALLAVDADRVAAAPAVVDAADPPPDIDRPARPRPASSEPLQVEADPKRFRLADGAEVTIDVEITVAPRYHVNAHEPGIDYLIPLEITLQNGAGLEIEVAYPAGETYNGPEGVMKVHHGTVTIPVTVRRVGPITGRPRLMLSYQVCDDKVCLAPDTKRIPIAVIAD